MEEGRKEEREDGDEKKGEGLVGKKGSGKEEKRKNLKKEKKKSQGRGGAPVRERLNDGRSAAPFFVLARRIALRGREGYVNQALAQAAGPRASLSCVCARVCVYTHPSGRVRAIRGGLVLLGGSVKNDEPFGSSSPSSSFCCCVVQFFLIRSETIAKLVLRQCVCLSLCVLPRQQQNGTAAAAKPYMVVLKGKQVSPSGLNRPRVHVKIDSGTPATARTGERKFFCFLFAPEIRSRFRHIAEQNDGRRKKKKGLAECPFARSGRYQQLIQLAN